MHQADTKPNGPVAAAFIAAGIATATLGLVVIVAEASPAIRSALDFAKNYGLGSGVGPLSGKVAVATLAYAASWVVLHLALRGKELPWSRVLWTTLGLVALGFLLTFPPIFLLFEAPAA
jgi:hypothetical protein